MNEAAAATPTLTASKPAGALPFSIFERMVAWRYLRAKRKEGVTSMVAIISFVGIMLGVAALIVVMAVMNGFREELLSRILGTNGHLVATPMDTVMDDYEPVTDRINGVNGVKFAMPLIEGQVLVQGNTGSGAGALRTKSWSAVGLTVADDVGCWARDGLAVDNCAAAATWAAPVLCGVGSPSSAAAVATSARADAYPAACGERELTSCDISGVAELR